MKFGRRVFLGGAAVLMAGTRAHGAGEERVMTVTGAVNVSGVGLMLPHEHLFSNFGADAAEHARYEESALLAQVVPYGRKLKELGCDAVADCTAAWFGRRPDLLAKISRETGLKILTNTGLYGAANDRYVPEYARSETADQLAARWIGEWENGIGDSGIRPGFMKIGVDPGALSKFDAKLVRAAAITHRETGLAIAVHTGASTESVRGQLGILGEEGVAPSAWIWVHANKMQDATELVRVARQGGWVELDGVSADAENNAEHLRLLGALRESGYLDRVLLSHDGNSFRYGGRPMKPYDGLFTHFLPAMKKAGYGDEEIRQVTVLNPRQAFRVARRLRR